MKQCYEILSNIGLPEKKLYLQNTTRRSLQCKFQHREICVKKLLRVDSQSLRIFQFTRGLQFECGSLKFEW